MRLCDVPGCKNKHFARGYCRKHHARFMRNGTTESKYDMSRHSKHIIDNHKDPKQRGYLYVNIINDIKYKAEKRKKDWHLTHEQAFKLITSSCLYCGYTPKWPTSRVGIDRVDNSIGYIEGNCVPCCFTCNSAKGTLSLQEFKNWVLRVAKTFLNKDSK